MATTQIQKAVLVIADIGGYTKFMQLTRMNLAHAQAVVADLLEAVIDAAEPLRLSKLEGDAALFWSPVKDESELGAISEAVVRIRGAFLARRQQLTADSVCNCESCGQISNLKLKFVAHNGEIALQKVKRNVELAGVDVILVHRMLKNDVPLKEYVLMTDELKSGLPEALRSASTPLQHDFEGIGEVQTHYVDLSKVEAPAPQPKQGGVRKWLEKAKLELGALPYVLGFKKPLHHGYEKLRESIAPPPAEKPE